MQEETISPVYSTPDPSLDRYIFDSYLDKITVAIGVLDEQLRYLRVNSLLAEMNGFDQESHIGRHYSEIIPSIVPVLDPIFAKILTTGESILNVELVGETLDRPTEIRHWVADFHALRGKNGKPSGIVAIVREITDVIRAQHVVKQSESLMRKVLDNLFTFVAVLTPDGTFLEANAAPLNAAGIRLEDVRAKKVWDCYWFNYSAAIQSELKTAIKRTAKGEVWRYDVIVRMAGDSRMTIDLMLAPLFDESGTVSHIIASAIDITDRIEGQNALIESEERFRRVVEAITDGIAMVDIRGKVVMVNSSMERLFGYSRNELIGQSIEALIPFRYLEEHENKLLHYMVSSNQSFFGEADNLLATRKDGAEFPITMGLQPLLIDKCMNVLITVTDITKRKADQKIIEKALEEKTALLNEVHHRVKNNLQVISSLISLQSRAASKEAAAVLLESQNRVRAMALIHQLLYEKNDFSTINLKLYLNRLCMLLRESMGSESSRIKLVIDEDSDEISIELQRALPCGLLINELITNAIRHAFPGQVNGVVRIAILAQDNNKGIITVADKGVGLPPNIEFGKTNSLGFQLIPMLVDQIEATLTMENKPGPDNLGLNFVLELNRVYKVEV